MRIAFYVGAFKENQDGATKSLYKLVHALQADGMDVGVWTYDPPPENWRNWITRFTVPSLPLPLYPAYRVSLPGQATLHQLDRFRPDMVHVAVADLAGRAFQRYGLERQLPVVASYHTDFASYLKHYGLAFLTGLAQKSLAAFFNRCHWVYAPTPAAIHDLESWGVQRIRLWSRGVDQGQFHPRLRTHSLRRDWRVQERKVILFSGRLVPYKNLDTVIAVYNKFQARLPGKVRFVLLGDGPWLGKLQRAMPEAVFTGYLHGRQLSAVYASADLLLFPSTTETFGNVVLEALASGVPAVVSDRGGCADIIRDSGAGIICPAADHEAFFQACCKLVEHSVTHAALRALGLKYAAGRSWSAINLSVIEDYRIIAAYEPFGQQAPVPGMAPRLKHTNVPQQEST